MTLAGRAVVLPVGLSPAEADAVARRLAEEGAAVVLVAPGADDKAAGEAGRLAAALAESGARTAVLSLAGDRRADLDALVELLGELFP